MRQPNRHLMIALAVLTGFATGGNALAGDRALVDVIGYSPDGLYFAFEEFGIADGAGFAYSNTYVVNLADDRFVVGTPISIRAEDESESLHALRLRAKTEVQPRLEDIGISLPAVTAATIGDGVPGSDGLSLSFGVPAPGEPGTVAGKYDLSLETFPVEAASSCRETFGDTAQGLAIKISDFGASREVYRDQSLPRSRGCPVAYRFYGVYLPFNATDISRAATLISVYAHGFEGADRRFIAIPLASSF